MNAELQVFQYCQTMDVRMVMRGDEPWWVLADVCRVLEIKNSRDVVGRLDDDEKGVGQIDTPGGPQEMTIINESGLYSVILRSDKPQAKAFKRWVTHEVLPSIRKTGGYRSGRRLALAGMGGPDHPPMPPIVQTLWLTLLYLDEEQGGSGTVAISNLRLKELLGISSTNTLKSACNRLEKDGYIEREPGVKAHPSVYKLLSK